MANWSTNSIFKSECSVKLDTNQGVEVILRRVIDWKAWMVRIWGGLEHPKFVLHMLILAVGDIYTWWAWCRLKVLILKLGEVDVVGY